MSKKILIIDDVVFNIEFEANLLQSLMDELNVQMQIDTAICVKDAVALIEKNDYHAMIIDMNLPDGSGVDIAKAAHKKNPKSYLAGITIFPDAYEDVHEHFDLFLKKPIVLETYKENFSRLLQID